MIYDKTRPIGHPLPVKMKSIASLSGRGQQESNLCRNNNVAPPGITIAIISYNDNLDVKSILLLHQNETFF